MYMREYILGRRISGETGTVRHSESWVQLLKQLTVVSARNKQIFSKYQLSSLDLQANLNSGVPDIQTSGVPILPEFQPNNRLDLLLLGLCLLGRNSISLSGSSPERPLAELLPGFVILVTACECGCPR